MRKNNNYVLGLDIGVTSVGYGVYQDYISENMNLNELFISRKDRLDEYLVNKKPYTVKKIEERGHSRESYVCPRRNEFGLKVFGETGCLYCKYCGALEEMGKGRYGSNYNVYCCYPKQVNKETDPSLEQYESNAPIF